MTDKLLIDRVVLEQVLKALEYTIKPLCWCWAGCEECDPEKAPDIEKITNALRAAMMQKQERLEPVQEPVKRSGITKDWCVRMAQMEMDAGSDMEIGVALVQKPTFYGFMSDDGTQVDVCVTPSAPRIDGTYATAYYTTPPPRPLAQQPEPVGTRALVEECLAAFAEELAAWDIDPPLHHVKQAHDKCEAWIAALAQQQAEPVQEWVSMDEYKRLQGLVTSQGIRLMEYESKQPQPEPVREPETVDQRVVPLVESALQAVAEKIGDQCAVWYGIGARDVEAVLREAARYGLVHDALAAPAQEPVAWECKAGGLKALTQRQYDAQTAATKRHYTRIAPPQRPPLTDEEIVEAVREADLDWQVGWTLDEHEPNRFTTLARAIERKVRGET